jgi:hypothetical protein
MVGPSVVLASSAHVPSAVVLCAGSEWSAWNCINTTILERDPIDKILLGVTYERQTSAKSVRRTTRKIEQQKVEKQQKRWCDDPRFSAPFQWTKALSSIFLAGLIKILGRKIASANKME